MQTITTGPKIIVIADGAGAVSHAGSRLLADIAGHTTLTGELAQALAELRRPGTRHDPGRVLVDLAVAVADGATTISEIDVLRDQSKLFRPVASDSTCWRLLDRLDDTTLTAVAAARARAREVVWDQYAERHGLAFPPANGPPSPRSRPRSGPTRSMPTAATAAAPAWPSSPGCFQPPRSRATRPELA